MKKIDLTGQKFGMLTVIGPAEQKNRKIPPWQHRGGIFISERYGRKVPGGVMSGAFLFI